MEKQKLFDGSEVPTRAMQSDIVIRSDDSEGTISSSFADCRGGFHATEQECLVRNVVIVEEVLNAVDDWVSEYTTENEDYAEGYVHCVCESKYNWTDPISEWVKEQYADHDDYEKYAGDLLDKVVEGVIDRLDDNLDIEFEFNPNEYACYSGPGCELDSYEIGEYEEEVHFENHPELKELHDARILDDVLDHVNCNAYVYRSKCRKQNKETGKYEVVGRDTYNCWSGDSDHITTYHCPGGRWHFIVPAGDMRRIVTEVVLNLCRG